VTLCSSVMGFSQKAIHNLEPIILTGIKVCNHNFCSCCYHNMFRQLNVSSQSNPFYWLSVTKQTVKYTGADRKAPWTWWKWVVFFV